MAGPTVRCAGPAERLPSYQSAGAAGADLHAHLGADLVIPPGGRATIPTGLHVEIPPGFEGQVRPRSGMAAGHGVTVLNAPGTVDSDYRGEVQVILINLGAETFRVRHGDRIAQLVITPVVRADFSRAGAVGDTERGSGGFGSTGT
jgi:dUTP pyrophosphatase